MPPGLRKEKNMKKILITGAAGYIGNALVDFLTRRGDLSIITADNNSRARWVEDCGGKSLTVYKRHPCILLNLMHYPGILHLITVEKPDVIIHLASQPSAPWSEKDLKRRFFTQNHNMTILLNLLFALRESGLDPAVIVTTTTGIPGAPESPIL